MSLTYKQAYEQKDEIISLLNNPQPEEYNKIFDFFIRLSEAHHNGAEWVEDFLEEYDLAHLFVSFLQSNKDFRQRFIERRGNDNGNL